MKLRPKKKKETGEEVFFKYKSDKLPNCPYVVERLIFRSFAINLLTLEIFQNAYLMEVDE